MQIVVKSKLIVSMLFIIGFSACDDNFMDDFQVEKSHDELATGSADLVLLQANRNGTPHHFPNVDVIKEDPEVMEAMIDAWNKMLSLVVPYKHRTEIGFYIYYDEKLDRFWRGPLVLGEKTDYTSIEPPSVNLGAPSDNLKVCATFHCHTPYYGIDSRPSGPSDQDKELAQKNNLPGIVFDYPRIQPLDANYPYDGMPPYPYTYGPTQRPDIYY